MDRASDSGSEGWGFESLPVYQKSRYPFGYLLFWYSGEEGTRKIKCNSPGDCCSCPARRAWHLHCRPFPDGNANESLPVYQEKGSFAIANDPFSMISVPCGNGWYRLRDDICSADDIRFAYEGNRYYVMLAKQVYHTACRISYRQRRYIIERCKIYDIIEV